MSHPKPIFDILPENHFGSKLPPEHCTRVQPDYVAVFNERRKRYVRRHFVGYSAMRKRSDRPDDRRVYRSQYQQYSRHPANPYEEWIPARHMGLGTQERDQTICPLRNNSPDRRAIRSLNGIDRGRGLVFLLGSQLDPIIQRLPLISLPIFPVIFVVLRFSFFGDCNGRLAFSRGTLF